MRLIAKVFRISRAKFHCSRLTTAQDIQDYASHFWDTLYIVSAIGTRYLVEAVLHAANVCVVIVGICYSTWFKTSLFHSELLMMIFMSLIAASTVVCDLIS